VYGTPNNGYALIDYSDPFGVSSAAGSLTDVLEPESPPMLGVHSFGATRAVLLRNALKYSYVQARLSGGCRRPRHSDYRAVAIMIGPTDTARLQTVRSLCAVALWQSFQLAAQWVRSSS
jgi:hypothetical protein